MTSRQSSSPIGGEGDSLNYAWLIVVKCIVSLCAYHHRYLVWLFHNQVLIFTHSVFLVKNSLLYGMPSLLYQTDGQERNDDGKWQRYVIPLPEGDFRLQFVFTMGYPFESAAGLDSVTLIACGTGNDMLPLQGDERLEVGSVRTFSVNLPKLFTLCPSNLCSFSCALFSVILSANQHSFTHSLMFFISAGKFFRLFLYL